MRMYSLKIILLNYMVIITLYHSIFTMSAGDESYKPTYLYHFCTNATTFTPNSIYQSNLNELLVQLASKPHVGEEYYKLKVGDNNESTVYGCYLCRGDVNSTACMACVEFATKDAMKWCPVEKEMVLWYDECMLRYSNRSFFDTMDERPKVALLNTDNATNEATFMKVLGEILDESATEVENGAKRFLTKQINFTGFQNIYTLMQCTPDISGADCTRCLRDAIALFSFCCGRKLGGRVYCPSCNVRYEVYPFYFITTSNPTLVIPPPPSPPIISGSGSGTTRTPPVESPRPLQPPPGKSRRISRLAVASIVIVTSLFALALGCGLLYHRRAKVLTNYDVVDRETEGIDSLKFDFVTIEKATERFSGDYKLGEGGFGEVYKGILAQGQEIAVKRLSKSSAQGEQEFKNEVALVAKLQHRNLVRLLGYCLEGGETLLVYEFIHNKSLDYFLFDSEKQRLLDWSTRCKIIGGIAKGILYLHEDSRLKVIHRDLKASNILLDENMNPKISDFGMARMVGIDQTQGNTKRIVGTYGYMAPEYAMEGLYSVKSDVFSFGVLLLEILSGKKNSGFHLRNSAPSLLAYAWQLWNEGKVIDLMDRSLKDMCPPNDFMRHVHIGLLCVQEDAYNRPTMSSVILMLTTETISLPKPERPAFSVGRFKDDRQEFGTDGCSDNGLTISVFGPR